MSTALIALASTAAVGTDLPRSSPEAQGISSQAILEFVEEAEKSIDSLHSFMFGRHAHVVAEGWWSPYRVEAPHSLCSLSESFTSTAVGLAIAEGTLSLDDELVEFFPKDTPPEPSKNLRSMRVRELLCMSTGRQKDPPRTEEGPWTQSFLAHPIQNVCGLRRLQCERRRTIHRSCLIFSARFDMIVVDSAFCRPGDPGLESSRLHAKKK